MFQKLFEKFFKKNPVVSSESQMTIVEDFPVMGLERFYTEDIALRKYNKYLERISQSEDCRPIPFDAWCRTNNITIYKGDQSK